MARLFHTRFLLAANSALLCSCLDLDHRDGTDSDAPSVVLLPGVSSATVGTMLRCTLDLAVRRDVLSVNEQHVMRLLGFRIPNDGGKEGKVSVVVVTIVVANLSLFTVYGI